MDINWVTFIAQIINFLVLVWLLKRFLYGPIVRAMDAREQKFVDRMRELEEATDAARRESDEYRERLEELQRTKEELLAEATREVEAWKREHLKAARKEVEHSRSEWYRGLARERQSLLRDLRLRVAREVFDASRRVLQVLCNESLEARAIAAFERELKRLDASRRAEVAQAIVNSRHHVVVETGFPLDQTMRLKLEQLVHTYLAEGVAIDFAVKPDLICGVELRAAGYKVAWSADRILGNIEETFAEALDGELLDEFDREPGS